MFATGAGEVAVDGAGDVLTPGDDDGFAPPPPAAGLPIAIEGEVPVCGGTVVTPPEGEE